MFLLERSDYFMIIIYHYIILYYIILCYIIIYTYTYTHTNIYTYIYILETIKQKWRKCNSKKQNEKRNSRDLTV